MSRRLRRIERTPITEMRRYAYHWAGAVSRARRIARETGIRQRVQRVTWRCRYGDYRWYVGPTPAPAPAGAQLERPVLTITTTPAPSLCVRCRMTLAGQGS